MKVLMAVFSATGNTAAIGKAIGRRLAELGAEVEYLDVTALADRSRPVDLSPYQALVVGSPIHSMRAPRLVRDWLETLDGQGKKCALFLTYGGFQVHPAHATTQNILRRRGFDFTASAEFPGKHTFNLGGWQALPDRPNEPDFATAREYAEKIHPRLAGLDSGRVGDLDPGPYTEQELDAFEQFRFKMADKLPSRGGEDCSLCLLCQDQCPTGAMNAEQGAADPAKCILCLRCLAVCPEQALKFCDMSAVFKMKMAHDKETPESLAGKKSRMYL
ncbi:MAG: EFR1 family ferrodoxin [Pseudomonadota bacterium]